VEAVDESETGSANFFGPASAGPFFLDPFHTARLAGAVLEKGKGAICDNAFFDPLDHSDERVSVLLAPSTERE
jgi:hypothetical protein